MKKKELTRLTCKRRLKSFWQSEWHVVEGVPEPKAVYFNPKTGITYYKKTYRQWYNKVIAKCKEIAKPSVPLDHDITFEVVFMVKNANKKPDIDNLAACVLNAAVKSGIITDDSRVIELHVRKETSKTLGMKFKISGYYYELENNNRGLQENN